MNEGRRYMMKVSQKLLSTDTLSVSKWRKHRRGGDTCVLPQPLAQPAFGYRLQPVLKDDFQRVALFTLGEKGFPLHSLVY